MLVFVENIGHKYDFQGGVGWSMAGSGVGGSCPDPKKKVLTLCLLCIVPFTLHSTTLGN